MIKENISRSFWNILDMTFIDGIILFCNIFVTEM